MSTGEDTAFMLSFVSKRCFEIRIRLHSYGWWSEWLLYSVHAHIAHVHCYVHLVALVHLCMRKLSEVCICRAYEVVFYILFERHIAAGAFDDVTEQNRSCKDYPKSRLTLNWVGSRGHCKQNDSNYWFVFLVVASKFLSMQKFVLRESCASVSREVSISHPSWLKSSRLKLYQLSMHTEAELY